jgi:high-affinity iron transporter
MPRLLIGVGISASHLSVGHALGVLRAALLSLVWAKFGRRINLARFFQVTAVFMVLFSIPLLIYSFHESTEGRRDPRDR